MVSDTFFKQIPGTALSPIHRDDFKSLGLLAVGKSAPTLENFKSKKSPLDYPNSFATLGQCLTRKAEAFRGVNYCDTPSIPLNEEELLFRRLSRHFVIKLCECISPAHYASEHAPPIINDCMHASVA